MSAAPVHRGLVLALLVAISQGILGAAAQTSQLLPLDHPWRYEGSGAELGTAWRTTGYDDSAWPSGPAVLATPIDHPIVEALTRTQLSRTGTNGDYKVTDYFRARFNVPELQPGWFVMASNLVDDGAVFYLNGTEWFRHNMPTGVVTAATYAAQTIGVDREGIFAVTNLSGSLLSAGENVLAVEVHQPYLTSSDTALGVVLFYAPQDPLVIVRQPAHQAVDEGRPVLLNIVVTGSIPRYQWFKNGVPIPGATQPTLAVSETRRDDAGHYFVVASNDISAVTSQVAAVTVSPDTLPPTLREARKNLYLYVRFSEALDLNSVTNPANYRVTAPNGGAVTVNQVWVTSQNAVELDTAPLTPGFTHLLFVSGVRDRFGNVIEPNSGMAVAGTVTNGGVVVDGPPQILTQPRDLTVNEGDEAVLAAHLFGADTLQWWREGGVVPGATTNTLVFPAARPEVSGAYTLVASNTLGAVTSRVARLTVMPDLLPPRLLSARMGTNQNRVMLSFSEPLDAISAGLAANYTLTNQLGAALTVLSALVTNGTNVILTTSPRGDGDRCVVAVHGVRDASAAANPVTVGTHAGIDLEALVFTYDWVWLYNESGTNLGTTWRERDYDDSAWPRGPGLLGFDGGAVLPAPILTTLLPPEYTGVTHYFRTWFNVAGDPAGLVLRLRHAVDDGVVFHLNGREVHRIRVPEGQNYLTVATTAVETQAEGPFELPSSALVAGNNLLAAEVHQNSRVSADVVFGAEVTSAFPPAPPVPTGPVLRVQHHPDGPALVWDALDFALEQAEDPNGPWQLVPQPTLPFFPPPAPHAQFYRLQAQE